MTRIIANGIRPDGQYGLVLEEDELYSLIEAECKAVAEEEELQAEPEPKYLGPPPSVDPLKLAKARWGVIWPPEPLTEEEEDHREALESLIERRRREIDIWNEGLAPHQFNYQTGWTVDDFLKEEGRYVQTGNMQVDTVPYYLCIVGSPERIPWHFQLNLSSEYAVGRLWFDDPADCGQYVQHLLGYEEAKPPLINAREALFVAPQHPPPDPTQRSAINLVQPLHDWLHDNPELKFDTSLLMDNRQAREATKANFVKWMRGQDPVGEPRSRPALLFTAGHGFERDKPWDEQRKDQGALVFQDWPGWPAPAEPEHYLTSTDVTEDEWMAGMVAFCFACYSAGTPLNQDWVRETFFRSPAQIASAPFVARLPQKLLAQGLVAFVGHVSKAWGSSFTGVSGGDQTGIIREVLGELLRGRPVGHATDWMNKSWLYLTRKLDEWLSGGAKLSKGELFATWLARNDLRGYAILGDPAARLRVDLLQKA